MSQFELSPAIPQLPSGDIEKTATFFQNFLGFDVATKLEAHNFLNYETGSR